MEESTCSYCGYPNHSGNETVCDRRKCEYALPLKISDGVMPSEDEILLLSERQELIMSISNLGYTISSLKEENKALRTDRDHANSRNHILRSEKSTMKVMCDKAGLYRTEMNDYRRILEEILPTTLQGTKTHAKITRVLSKYQVSE